MVLGIHGEIDVALQTCRGWALTNAHVLSLRRARRRNAPAIARLVTSTNVQRPSLVSPPGMRHPQELSSLTVRGGLHVPARHVPPSSHFVPSAVSTSVGHLLVMPSHVSSTSHVFVAARQTVPAADKTSAGHVASFPEHISGASHSAAEARQTVVEARNASAGQVLDEPSHVSAASQGPAAVRQVFPAPTALHVPSAELPVATLHA